MKVGELNRIIGSLIQFPKETEWVEFKHNNADPNEIGEYISALSNSAALHREGWGYILWGVADDSHLLAGTTFKPHKEKIGNQELENWLVTQLLPRIDISIFEGKVGNKDIVLFQIQPATHIPVRFKGSEYIRVGSYKKKLGDHPEKERALWALFNEVAFESGTAMADISSDEVLGLLDYPSYFRLMNQPLPDNRKVILSKLESEGLITQCHHGRYAITNLGAILFASRLSAFGRLIARLCELLFTRGPAVWKQLRNKLGKRDTQLAFRGQ